MGPTTHRGDVLTGLWRHPHQAPDLSPRGWELLLGQARRSLLMPRLALLCDATGVAQEPPERVRRYLEAERLWAEQMAGAFRREVDALAAALAPLQTPVVLLKGAAYLMAGLPPARGRLFSDVDILVPKARLDEAEAALMAAGWITQERDAYNQRYYRQWMHEIPPLKHVVRGSVLDLHHTITPPTSRFAVDGGRLLAQARPLQPGGMLMVLDLPDMVLHSAVHLFSEGEFDHGLRDLLDMDDLVRHGEATDPGFWPALIGRARELGLTVPLGHALAQLERLFGTRPPPALAAEVARLQPARLQRRLMGWPMDRLMGWLLERGLRPDHPACNTRGTGLARWLLYVRSHWLRMPPHLVATHLLRKAWMQRFPARDKPPTLTV